MKVRVGIIGFGKIGAEVGKRVLEEGWEIEAVTNTSGVFRVHAENARTRVDGLGNWLEYFKGVDIGILCIPTTDDGLIAYEYIKALLERSMPVVTSEKGALGNYFPELKPWISRIGHHAAVGGGTRLLHWLKERLTRRTKEIHLIVNGTLNYIFDGLSRGRTLDEVVDEVKKLGYAEPGTQDALEVINKEACRDVLMKTAVLLNVCNFGEIRAKEINAQKFTEADLRKLLREAALRRYIVSINKEENDEEDVIGGFRFKINEWYVSAGFKNRTQNPLFIQGVPPGVNNAALVHGSNGTYILTGPGAGAVATAGAIMKDIEDLLGI